MSVTSALCTSYKKELLSGVHLSSDTYKILLLKVVAIDTYNTEVNNV